MAKVKANELTDASVAFISLVDRGANREPFRIIKRAGDETDMIDLSNGLKGLFKKSEARQPAVALVAFSKGYNPEAALALLKKADLTAVGDGQETDDGYVIQTLDGLKDLDQVVLFKLSDDVAIGVRFDEPETVKKGFSGYDYESTDYKAVLGTNTTMPMIGVAMSALQDTVWNIMANSDTVEVAKKDITKALKDFGGTVGEIVDRVPATAFKLEAAVSKTVTAKADDQGQATSTKKNEAEEQAETKSRDEEPGQIKPAGEADADKQADKGAEAAADAADKVKEGDDKAKVEKTDAAASTADTADSAVLAAIKKMGEELTGKIDGVTETVKKQGEKLDAVEKTASSTAASIKKMDEELGTGVIGGDAGGEQKTTVSKADLAVDEDDAVDEGGYIVLDTAYEDPFKNKAA